MLEQMQKCISAGGSRADASGFPQLRPQLRHSQPLQPHLLGHFPARRGRLGQCLLHWYQLRRPRSRRARGKNWRLFSSTGSAAAIAAVKSMRRCQC